MTSLRKAVAFSPLILLRLTLCACVALSVSACQKPKPKPVAIVTKPLPPKPLPQDLPLRKEGLWDFQVSEDGSSDAPRSFQICLDANIEAHLGIMGFDLSKDRCDKNGATQNPDGTWAILSVCHVMPQGQTSYSGTIKGDYETSYSMSLRAQTIGAASPQMNRIAQYSLNAKRLGECKSGQEPGDMTESGVTINLNQMSKPK